MVPLPHLQPSFLSNLEVFAPSLTVQPYEQKELSVLIGLVGGIKGRLIIDTSSEVIDKYWTSDVWYAD